MKKIYLKKLISLILIAALIMSFVTGCGQESTNTGEKGDSQTMADEKATNVSEESVSSDTQTKSFDIVVVDRDGNEESFTIETDKTTVGEALLEQGIIEGTDSEYGLYVTKVNGIEAIYENDGTYWSFYINDEYAMSGVDSTNIEEGVTYKFKVEK